MAFPFWWVGALSATLFLGAAFLVFGIAMRLVSRTSGEIRGSMLPGLVSGFRNWADGRDRGRASSSDVERALGEQEPESPPATERVRRR